MGNKNKKVKEKTITRKREKITLYRIGENCWTVVMEDVITDEVLVDYEFDNNKEAIEYFSELYNSL